MTFLAFIFGVIIGTIGAAFYMNAPNLARAIEADAEEKMGKSQEGNVSFIDPITPAERFKEAKSIDDIVT